MEVREDPVSWVSLTNCCYRPAASESALSRRAGSAKAVSAVRSASGSSVKVESKLKEESSFLKSVDALLAHEAELYFWDNENEEFIHQGIVIAQILQKKGGYDFWIAATVDGQPQLAHRIDESMNQRFSQKMKSITWNNITDSGCTSWLFRFGELETYDAFFVAFGRALYQNVNKVPWDKAKVGDFTVDVILTNLFLG